MINDIGEMSNERIHIITQSLIALILVLGGGISFVFLQINNYNGGDALIGLMGAVSSYYFINGAIRQAVASTQRTQRDATVVAQQAQAATTTPINTDKTIVNSDTTFVSSDKS
jgi:hypothetical protein